MEKHGRSEDKPKWAGYALITVAVLITIAIAACSTTEPTPPSETRPIDNELLDSVERLNAEIAALRREVQKSKATQDIRKSTTETGPEMSQTYGTPTPMVEDEATPALQTTVAPTPAASGNEPRPETAEVEATPVTPPTPAPQAAVIPTPVGPGICGRSPWVQEAILTVLRTNSCQFVNEAEMFRINENWHLTGSTFKPGDFQGLVNIDSVSGSVKELQAGGFIGLTNAKSMRIAIHKGGSVSADAWLGLDNLEALELRGAGTAESHSDSIALPDFKNLPKLRHLKISSMGKLTPDTVSETLFSELASLETLTLNLETERDNDELEDAHLPDELFAGNPALKEVSINIHSTPERRIYLGEGFFLANGQLQKVELSGGDFRTPKDLFAELTELNYLSIARRDNDYRPELTLSKESPLYKRAEQSDTWTSGYKIAGIEN